MLNQNFENNTVNGTGTPCEYPLPGSCFLTQQWELACHPATATVRWNKEVNKVVMECFYRSKAFDEERELIRR